MIELIFKALCFVLFDDLRPTQQLWDSQFTYI